MGRTAPAALELMGWGMSPPRLDSPIAANSAGIVLEHLAERRLVEIRPVLLDEDEFGIGALPEQEVREPLLAAGADDDVRIGHARGVESPANSIFGDVFGLEPARANQRRNTADRLHNLGLAAVVKGDLKLKAGIERRGRFHHGDQAPQAIVPP